MLGAIAGDIIGSVHEGFGGKRKNFELFTSACTFTDDTVLTVAVADAILKGGSYGEYIKAYARAHPHRGYGGNFAMWAMSDSTEPYYSFGNGSAMRVSAVAHAFDNEEAVLREAEASAACTHNHPEGIKGAQAVALAAYLARKGAGREAIRTEIEERFGYDLHRTIEAIRPRYLPDVTCQGSVPEAIIAFLDSSTFEDTIRNAVSLGGDADTQAAMAGAIAELHYDGVPAAIAQAAWERLPESFHEVLRDFARQYGTPKLEGV